MTGKAAVKKYLEETNAHISVKGLLETFDSVHEEEIGEALIEYASHLRKVRDEWRGVS